MISGLEGGQVYVAEDNDKDIVGVAIWIILGRSLPDTYDLSHIYPGRSLG